jgi:hypothetical protein
MGEGQHQAISNRQPAISSIQQAESSKQYAESSWQLAGILESVILQKVLFIPYRLY